MILVTGTTGQLGGVASEFRRGENFFNNPRSGGVASEFRRVKIFLGKSFGTASIFAIASKTQKKSGEHAK